MKTISSVSEFRKFRKQLKGSVGFVPTMGALHGGHLSLVKKSISVCNYTIVSIFLNPAQFSIDEDLSSYPRTIEKDLMLLKGMKVDAVFVPSSKKIYLENHSTFIYENSLTKHLEGSSRPHFFQGVTTIVAKLFNIVQPSHSFFGEKDAQQLIVVKKMVKDLNYAIEIVSCPTIRDKNGLAMSSRNQYLSKTSRLSASIIYLGLSEAIALLDAGEKNPSLIKKKIEKTISRESSLNIDYIMVSDKDTLEEITNSSWRNILISLAVYIEGVRLIDNVSYVSK